MAYDKLALVFNSDVYFGNITMLRKFFNYLARPKFVETPVSAQTVAVSPVFKNERDMLIWLEVRANDDATRKNGRASFSDFPDELNKSEITAVCAIDITIADLKAARYTTFSNFVYPEIPNRVWTSVSQTNLDLLQALASLEQFNIDKLSHYPRKEYAPAGQKSHRIVAEKLGIIFDREDSTDSTNKPVSGSKPLAPK